MYSLLFGSACSRYSVLLTWLIITILGLIAAPKFMGRTAFEFSPPKDSRATRAQAAAALAFPSTVDQTPLVLVVQQDSNKHHETGGASGSAHGSCVPSVSSINVTQDCLASLRSWLLKQKDVSHVETVASVTQEFGAAVAARLQSTDGCIELVDVTLTTPPFSQPSQEFVADLMQALPCGGAHTSLSLPGDTSIVPVGLPAFLAAMRNTVANDLERIDTIALPIAMVVMALVLRSPRLLVVPLLTLVASLAMSFGMMYFVSMDLKVVNVVPSLMVSFALAMNVDYSLFFFAEFRLNVRDRGMSTAESVKRAMRTGGMTIAVSGVTLTGCFLGMVLLRNELMITSGIACSITIAATVLAVLTIAPALTLSFPTFFAGSLACCGANDAGNTRRSRRASIQQQQFMAAASAEAGPTMDQEDEALGWGAGMWSAISTQLQSRALSIVLFILVVAGIVSLSEEALGLVRNNNVFGFMEDGAPTTSATHALMDSFGSGTVFPINLLLSPAPHVNLTVRSDAFFAAAAALLTNLSTSVPDTPLASIASPFNVNGTTLSYTELEFCAQHGPPLCTKDQQALVRQALGMFLSTTEEVAYAAFNPPFNTGGIRGLHWLQHAREFADSVAADGDAPLHLHIWGSPVNTWDMVTAVEHDFVRMVVTTVAVIMVFIGCAFRSVLVPLVAISCAALTVIFTYAMVSFVYNPEGVGWTTAIMAFPLIVGLGLDYFVFLATNSQEQWLSGETPTAAVHKSLLATGSIITAAGIIMAISFGGLFFSATPMLRQVALFLVVAVLLDTFLIRSIYQPIVCYWLKGALWFPKRRPNILNPERTRLLN